MATLTAPALFLVASLSLFSRPVAAQEIRYVDVDATGAADGSSWSNAYRILQAALDQAQSTTSPVEIWVAEGTYRPTQQADPTDARTATFQLLGGVAIYGGFRGGETSRSARDPQANETILSGDIGTAGFAGDNAYHVVTGSGVGGSAVLDGFTITDGRANGTEAEDRDGGGMYNEEGSPTLRNCRFTGNRAQDDGGAVYNWFRSNPSITNCVFEDNTAGFGGGAIRNGFESDPLLKDVRFDENSAGLAGGALYNFNSSPTLLGAVFTGNVSGFLGGAMDNSYNSSSILINVRFAGNRADVGGAITNDDSDPSITNAVFSGNKGDDGGAVHNEASSPVITNATFSGNRADDGFGGGTGGAIASTDESFPQIRNSVLWGNSARQAGSELYTDESSQPLVGHSIVEGALPAGVFDDGHNLDQNPEFERPVDPSTAPTLAGDLRVLTDGAPGLDAADERHLSDDRFDLDGDGNVTEPLPVDLDGTDRLVDNNADGTATPDLGAYEAPPSVLPVELAFLDAELDGRVVRLTWQTASETSNAGFVVQRHRLQDSLQESPNETGWEKVGFVEGTGTTSEAQRYQFVDRALPREGPTLRYRLKQVDVDGSAHYSEAVEVELTPPATLRLYAPYPNPSKERATVHFAVPTKTAATLSIYDLTGRRVALLPQGEIPRGEHHRVLHTAGLASGLYVLRLQTEDRSASQKMSIVR